MRSIRILARCGVSPDPRVRIGRGPAPVRELPRARRASPALLPVGSCGAFSGGRRLRLVDEPTVSVRRIGPRHRFRWCHARALGRLPPLVRGRLTEVPVLALSGRGSSAVACPSAWVRRRLRSACYRPCSGRAVRHPPRCVFSGRVAVPSAGVRPR